MQCNCSRRNNNKQSNYIEHFNHKNLCHRQKFKTYTLVHAVINISFGIINVLLLLASFLYNSRVVFKVDSDQSYNCKSLYM